jgi:hypothetical protein
MEHSQSSVIIVGGDYVRQGAEKQAETKVDEKRAQVVHRQEPPKDIEQKEIEKQHQRVESAVVAPPHATLYQEIIHVSD